MNPLAYPRDIYPQSVTILPSYRCNAECTECCFESNPRIRQRLSLPEIIAAIDEAKATFPPLQLVVFSGGEAFLLKHDLFAAIAHARSLGLRVRCVTNAFWGKTLQSAALAVFNLQECGVSEINISTGSDHQKFVPFASIENACVALVEGGISTLVTVEKDSPETRCLEQVRLSIRLRPLLEKSAHLLSVQCNSWMPFHSEYVARGEAAGLESLTEGCSQIFSNVVVTPYAKLAACCGLTFEHIPELTLGSLENADMGDLFDEGLANFLKIWIHLDGPATILRKLLGDEINEELREVRHICQACAVLHLHPRVREALSSRHAQFVPDVLARFALRVALQRRENMAVA